MVLAVTSACSFVVDECVVDVVAAAGIDAVVGVVVGVVDADAVLPAAESVGTLAVDS